MAAACDFIISSAPPVLADWQKKNAINTGYAFCQWQQQRECGALALTQQLGCSLSRSVHSWGPNSNCLPPICSCSRANRVVTISLY